MERHTIHIRRAKVTDIDTIVDFNAAMGRETENVILPRQRLKSGVTAIFEDSTKGFYIMAECDGKVVGQIMINYEWSDWRNATFWWVQSVYVLPGYRRAGGFRSLFEHIKHMAENASNVCGFRLYVEKNNHLAKQAYEGLGMEESHYELYEMLLD